MPLDIEPAVTETLPETAAEPVKVDPGGTVMADSKAKADAKPVNETETKEEVKDAKPEVETKADPDAKVEGKDEKDPKEGRIVELSRAKRTSEAKAVKADERATKAEAELKKYEPFHQLLGLAASDPLEFITQLAEATGLTPDKVTEAIATKAAGANPTPLGVEEKLAALQKRLDEKEAAEAAAKQVADQEAQDRQYTDARTKNIASTLEFVKVNAEEYPAAEADGDDAAEAIYEVVESRWAALKAQGRAPATQAEMQLLYKEAASRVNKILVEQTERRASKLGYEKQKVKETKTQSVKDSPKSIRGLSSEHAGRNAPARDPKAVLSDEEVLAVGDRIFQTG